MLSTGTPIPPEQLNDAAILNFIKSLKNSDLTPSSVKQAIDSCRFLYARVLAKRTELLKSLATVRREVSQAKVSEHNQPKARLTTRLIKYLNFLNQNKI